MTSAYRPEFEAALRLFARVSEEMAVAGFGRPILVGGAAVEFYSKSAINTGDFDICTPRQDALEAELVKAGFIRPAGAGQLLRGWIHPDLKMGFEVVATTPLDGAFDRDTLVLVENLDEGAFVILSVEDLIADRMGQYASGTAPEHLEQARVLFSLHNSVDTPYLERRIRQETMDEYGIEALTNG